MKRPLLITIGIVIILFVLGVWVYLMLFGTPKESGDVFSNLGFDFSPRDAEIIEPVTDTDLEYTVNTEGSQLQQLTTRPVAGFINVETASSSFVRYVERGTGHVYEINIEDGNEELISRTTIPRVQDAYFSPDGEIVALVSVTGYMKDTFVGMIDTEEKKLDGENLPPNAENIQMDGNETITYTREDTGSTVAYSYNFVSGSQRELFRVPFTEASVSWGEGDRFVYIQPAEELKGYLYEIQSGTFTPTDVQGYELTAEHTDDYIAYNIKDTGEDKTFFLNRTTGRETQSPITFIPEKCVFGKAGTVWCASPIALPENSTTMDWYKGLFVSEDYLWQISVADEEATLVVNFTRETGRPIDVTGLQMNEATDRLLFSNAVDGTLWTYSLTP